jgi:signal transduction histidine kinase/CheY-like chemotaxis protein
MTVRARTRPADARDTNPRSADARPPDGPPASDRYSPPQAEPASRYPAGRGPAVVAQHALLRRQLKRLFGTTEQPPEEWRPFINAVDQAYLEADTDRRMLERSLDLTSQEMLQLNAQMRVMLDDLEQRVQERTADLLAANRALREEVVERQRVQEERDRGSAERERLEDELRQSQKMEAVGRLAGGIAHDFNNLLTVIGGYTDLLQMRFARGTFAWNTLQEIRSAYDRAASLTRQLLAFSRRQLLQPQLLNINLTVENLQQMLQRLLGEDILLVTVLAPDLGLVQADPNQLDQVILNLAVNARDAMPEGGRLLIETMNVLVERSNPEAPIDVREGSYVMLSVSDTGSGMDAELRSRIFEPFFTTKDAGKGTGLGLSTVYGIVQQSGGSVTVISELGKGSAFRIYLPRLPDEELASPLTDEEPEPLRHESETILLVEDEDAVRRLARQVLEQAGYTVIEAGTCEAALRYGDAYEGRIHLLLTDVVLPDGRGPAVADQLTAQRPDLKVLFMSGHPSHRSGQAGHAPMRHALLQKPFTPGALVRKARDVIDEGEAHDGPGPGHAARS